MRTAPYLSFNKESKEGSPCVSQQQQNIRYTI
jgi:hypothetical protein